MDVVIDDHLLLDMLLNEEPPDLRRPGARSSRPACGIAAVPCSRQSRCDRLAFFVHLAGLNRKWPSQRSVPLLLPDTIRLLALRALAWQMAGLLDDGVRLNLLSLEALAAADQHGAELCLAAIDEYPQLLAAAAARRSPARLINQSRHTSNASMLGLVQGVSGVAAYQQRCRDDDRDDGPDAEHSETDPGRQLGRPALGRLD
ncbi:MAG: hypothetical protein M3N98_06815 [Actinomycetota bacterium]|nr:hypothetical protein [Actinomycetota bacterium]